MVEIAHFIFPLSFLNSLLAQPPSNPVALEILNGEELSLGRRKKVGAGASQERQVKRFKERGGPC